MSKQLKLTGIFNRGDCKYGGQFNLDGTDIGDRFEMSLAVVCRKTRFLFIPTGCTVKSVELIHRTQGYVDTYPAPIPNDLFEFELKMVDLDGVEDPDDDDCRIYKFHWKAWRYSSIDQVKPITVDIDGDFNIAGGVGAAGKGKAHAETKPYSDGTFRIKVCCKEKEVEGKTVCADTCTLLNP